MTEATLESDAATDRFAPRGALKVRAVRGGVVSVASQTAKVAVTVGSTAVLARLLSPEDYGVVAMVTALLGFTEVLRDLGLSIATVQRDRIAHDEVSALFWINALAGLALTLLMLASAPLVAWFYGRHDLVWVTCAYAGTGFVSSLGSQHQALLQRSMRFGALAVRDIVGLLAGAGAGIGSALLGLGYWSLVVMQLTASIVGVVALWWQSGWRPGPPRWSRRVLSYLRFGGAVTLQNILGFLVSGLDGVLIGHSFGAGDLGIYNRARGLLLRPIEQFLPSATSVATSAFSRLSSDSTRFERHALELLAIVSLVAGWVVALVMGTAPWLVALLLGPRWNAVVPIVSVLALFAFVSPSASILGTFLVVRGQPGRLVRWRLLSAPIALVTLAAGLPWGPLGVGTTMAVGGILVRAPLFFWYAGRTLGIPPLRLLRSVLHSVFSGLLAALVLIELHGAWFPGNPLVGLAGYAALGTLLYLAVVLSRREGRSSMRKVATLARAFRGE